MNEKTYIPAGEATPPSQIGATIEALYATIGQRRSADERSYTFRLLTGPADTPLKKVMEESGEVALAAKDADAAALAAAALRVLEPAAEQAAAAEDARRDAAVDHLRYEAADVVYHLLVVLARYGIDIDEFAAELNNRMKPEERPEGAIRLHDEYVRRGK